MLPASDELFPFAERLLLVISELLELAEATLATGQVHAQPTQKPGAGAAVPPPTAAESAAEQRLWEMDQHLQRLLRAAAGQTLELEERGELRRFASRYDRLVAAWAEARL